MSWKFASSRVHVSRKLGLNRHYRTRAKKGETCSDLQRGSTCAPVALARARARDDNYHGLPSTGNLWRSTRATASLLWGKKKRENGVREGRRETRRVREEECTCINFAPWHAAHTRLLAMRVVRSLYRHADFRNTGLHSGPPFPLDPILLLPSVWQSVSLPLRALCNINLTS